MSFPCSEKAVAPHSSVLAWKIPWTEEPGGLQSMGLLRVGHAWATSLSLFTFMHWRRQWQPTPSVLAWRIPGMMELGGLLSMGSSRVGQDCSDAAAAAAAAAAAISLWQSEVIWTVEHLLSLLLPVCSSVSNSVCFVPWWKHSSLKNQDFQTRNAQSWGEGNQALWESVIQRNRLLPLPPLNYHIQAFWVWENQYRVLAVESKHVLPFGQ